MNVNSILSAVVKWRDAHSGASPARAYVSQADADELAGGLVVFTGQAPFQFGTRTLGVTEWYVDPLAKDGTLRFEGSTCKPAASSVESRTKSNMGPRAEGHADWEFDAPVVEGAVPKFIAEVRAATMSVCMCSDETRASDEEIVAAFNRVMDALKAFDAAVKGETA